MPEPLGRDAYVDLVGRALAEDIGAGDITTRAIVQSTTAADAILLAKSPLVVAGLDLAREVFAQVDRDVEFVAACQDGDRVPPGRVLASLRGRAASLLTGERTALNLLQYLSGIATLTRVFVDAAAGRLVILDTRKTTPGLRTLAKYAVRAGGGRNHRSGLFDGILIKDNHIQVAGGVAEAVRLARAADSGLQIEVEAQDLAQVHEALVAGVDVIMLDNLDDRATREAIQLIDGRARVELSGNMTVARVSALADSGADFVSVGALTHSAPAVDISLDISL
jgi:nicotinate-nucleotide pyrophosphorylase (carboxylating)